MNFTLDFRLNERNEQILTGRQNRVQLFFR